MNKRTQIAGSLALLVTACLTAQAGTITLSARSGSKLRMEGTSNIHDWQCESPLILGSLQVSDNFPVEPGQAVNPAKVDVKGEAYVRVVSLKSKNKDGTPYEDKMDEVMWEHLKAQANPQITFRPTDLVLKEAPKSKDDPYVFDAKGELTVAGTTNAISMPINVVPMGDKDKKIKITGTVPLKMTDYKVEPPSPKFLPIHTGDEVKIIFTWMVAPKAAAAAAK
jgi:polyisoprenoid-binding protein YceI